MLRAHSSLVSIMLTLCQSQPHLIAIQVSTVSFKKILGQNKICIQSIIYNCMHYFRQQSNLETTPPVFLFFLNESILQNNYFLLWGEAETFFFFFSFFIAISLTLFKISVIKYWIKSIFQGYIISSRILVNFGYFLMNFKIFPLHNPTILYVHAIYLQNIILFNLDISV